jgi:hypothetical protein
MGTDANAQRDPLDHSDQIPMMFTGTFESLIAWLLSDPEDWFRNISYGGLEHISSEMIELSTRAHEIAEIEIIIYLRSKIQEFLSV